jgi:uncharacterized OB-fold protein
MLKRAEVAFDIHGCPHRGTLTFPATVACPACRNTKT